MKATMGFYRGCILFVGLLFVIGASGKAPDEKNCKKYVITKETEKTVTDENGDPARITSVTLLGEISFKACIEWYSYFFRGSLFTVRFGCKGAFKVCYKVKPTTAAPLTTEEPSKPGCTRITLRSRLNQVDQQEVRDEDGNRVRIRSMELFQQLDASLVDCVEWKTFFFFGSNVLAKKGCRGVFTVCFRVKVPPKPPTVLPLTTVGPECKNIRLLSRINRRETKTLPRDVRGSVTSITLAEQLSQGVPCVFNQNFGASGRRVFADKGCRGIFKVCVGDEQPLTTAPAPSQQECRKFVITKDFKQTIVDSNNNPVTISSVTLEKEFSFHVCFEWLNYFYTGSEFIVNKGCKGVFRVCYDVELPLTTAAPSDPGCVRVTLSSTLKKPDRKEVTDANGNPARIISMEVVRQISKVKCIEWFNFFFFGTSGIAKKGCRAVFKVCYKVKVPVTEPPAQLTTPAPVRPIPPGCTSVRLLSRLNRRAVKNIPSSDGRVISIKLLRQFPGVTCVRKQNFGANGNEVFSSGGCRGEFEVCLGKKPVKPPGKPGCAFVKLISSPKGKPVMKKVDGGGFPVQIVKLELIQDLSGGKCIEWKTYHATVDKIFAEGGCKGIFKVCYRPR